MLKKYFYYYRPYKLILAGVVAGSCLMALLDLLFPVLVRHIMNVELPAKNTGGILFWCAVLLILYLGNFVLIWAINYYGHIMSAGIENDMRRDLFAQLQRMSFRFFDNNKTGQLLSRITSDVIEVSELTFRGPYDLFVCVITMAGTIVILFWMNIYLGCLITLLLLGKTVHTVLINRRMKAAFRKNRSKAADVSAQAEEALSGIRLVKAFAAEDREQRRFMEVSNELYATRRGSFKILSYFNGSVNFFTNFTNLSLMACGGLLIAADKLTLSDFVAFLLYVNLFMKPLLRLTVFTEMYQRGMAGFARFYELMQLPEEIRDLPEAAECSEIKGHLRFENVTFGYAQERPVLRNFDLEILPGQKIAFVGATGAGKTTLANLLLRFYEPQQGRILLDGRDIRSFKQRSLRGSIGLVQQDVFLFSESVRFNIAYGKKDASEREIREAARLAAAEDFILRLPHGYDTCIGERGVKLSGGQKQRLAIARAFLKNPPVMILDEATSALDARTERAVQRSLDMLAQNRTTLIIAHRLTTIMNADMIVVIKDGQIAERGTHEELLAQNGLYKSLYDMNEE